MSGSTFGEIFKITSWGESHGDALGVVIDGCPSGIYLTEDIIQKDLDKRKPGNNNFSSKRKENDRVKILSGTFNNTTTGTPISMIVFNEDANSNDYSNIKDVFRPGHADYPYYKKYGIRDYRGGGRSSGRETISRVMAGSVAKQVLNELNINIFTYTSSIGEFNVKNIKKEETFQNEFLIPCSETSKKVKHFLNDIIKKGDSIGGTASCIISGVKAGIGEPVFNKLDAALAKAILSIGGTKGIEFGSGFNASKSMGSYNNDIFINKDNKITKLTNNSGGILGGISDGSDIFFKVAFKPTSSIPLTQNTVNKNGENVKINIKGRHDPVIVPRAIIVIESMVAITILDYMLVNLTRKIENLKSFYSNF